MAGRLSGRLAPAPRAWRRVALTLAGLAYVPAGPAAAGCPTGSGEGVSVAAVEARGELRLADGRLIRLVGLDPADGTPDAPDRADTARAALAAMLAGRAVTLTPLAASRDRWGRVPAFVFAGDGSAGGLAAAAIAAGLGRVLPEALAHACRDALLGAEATARAAKLGLWADPYYAVLGVDDERGFTERSGTRIIVGGTVVAIEPGPFRTVIRFARGTETPGTRRMLTAIVPARARASFPAGQLDAYLGRALRVRGLLDRRFGPQIELAGPDDVEVLPDGPSAILPVAVPLAAAPPTPAVPSR